MRVLFLCNLYHIEKKLVTWLDSPLLKDAGHEFIRCVGDPLAKGPDLPEVIFDLCEDTIHDIVKRIPGGPVDLMLVWEPGWQGLPQKIEEAPFPVVALFSDWNLTLRTQAGMLDAFDYIYTDRPGVDVVKRLGYDRVEYWPMWGHDPARFRVMPDVERIWDVTMIGNINPDIQRERAPWLYRLAKLGDKWKVRIAGNVFGDDYIRMLNQSKITFNRSIRKEFNMRCYEAPACGSLLFYDEDNAEVRDYFQDRVHCVLYNNDNFEELIEYYLTHDEARAEIVAAAQERVREISQPRALLQLLDRIQDSNLLTEKRPRPFAALPDAERYKRQARQIFYSTTPGNLHLANKLVSDALRQKPTDPALLNDYAVITAHMAGINSDFVLEQKTMRVAIDMAKRAVEANPKSALAHINLGQIYKGHYSFENAEEHFMKALNILNEGNEGPQDLLELHFPFERNIFRTQYEAIYGMFAGDDETLRLARQCLLIFQTGMALGELAEIENDYQRAGWAYQVAALARPDLGCARAALAHCLAELGQIDDALEQLEITFGTDPFLTKEWFTYADLLISNGRLAEARRFLEERRLVVENVTVLAHLKQPILNQLERIAIAESMAHEKSSGTGVVPKLAFVR
jgi:tetratricopeptide (TPR) repeat protein